jgi:glycerophosphoryl diester phosphodiesterase
MNTALQNVAKIAMATMIATTVMAGDKSHYSGSYGKYSKYDKYGKHHNHGKGHGFYASKGEAVQVGVRPYYLVNDMEASALKTELEMCRVETFKKSDFSIGHRGAAMQFPEHTKESYTAAARMGAGVIECDVTFTKDKELVCRHSQCDLHTTTNILETPLADKCSVAPVFDLEGKLTNAGDIQCCTSDITVAEFKTLRGKMDAANKNATTIADYMNATASWRTDLYASTGTVMTHAESIELFNELGVKMTPELKSPSVEMPFEGMTHEMYAQKMIDEYKEAGVRPYRVFAQSFNLNYVLYWLDNEPAFGAQAVFLDDVDSDADYDAAVADLDEVAALGVNIVAPPLWALVTLDDENNIVPSTYAQTCQANGLQIITWTLERSGTLTDGGGWYYQSITDAADNSGDTYELLDVLAQDVGVIGVFSDWPATVTFYANCKGLK